MCMKAIIKKIVPKKIITCILDIITSFFISIYSIKYKPLIIRKGTTDRDVFKAIFVRGEFHLPVSITPRLIIDAGAYTGLSTLYYAQTYPSAKIIAIEPESSNFSVLEKHTKHFANIVRLHAGLWDKHAHLKIVDRGSGNWGFGITEVPQDEPFDIQAVTIESVLALSGCEKIDILKLDIEGSEKQLFSQNYESWLSKVNIIVVELHDYIVSGCASSLYSAINMDEWKEYKSGEKVVLIRKVFV